MADGLISVTQLAKLRRDAAECQIIRDLATDPKKRELFDRLASHFSVLANVERAVLEGGKKLSPIRLIRTRVDDGTDRDRGGLGVAAHLSLTLI